MKIGIIGIGGVSRAYINSYLGINLDGKKVENPPNEIVAIADLFEEKIDETYKHYRLAGHEIPHKFFGPEAYKKVLELNLDAISITVQPNLDKEKILIEAMKTGIPLLVEKPLSHSLESAKIIADNWDGKSIVAMCYNWRNTFFANKFRELVQEETYGKLKYLSAVHCEPWAYYDQDSFYYQLGYLFEHNVHDINYLRFIGGEIRSLDAIAYGPVPNQSSLTVRFEYENGASGLFQSMTGTRTTSFYAHAAFEKGVVTCVLSDKNPDFDWEDVPYFRIFGPEGEIYSTPIFPMNDNDIKTRKVSWARVNSQGSQLGLSHPAIINNFLEAIIHHKEPKSNCRDGYQDLKLIDAIMRSLRNREKVLV